MTTAAKSLALALAGVLLVGAVGSLPGSIRGSNNASALPGGLDTGESAVAAGQATRGTHRWRAELRDLRATINRQQQQIDALIRQVNEAEDEISRLTRAVHTPEVVQRAMRSVVSVTEGNGGKWLGSGVVIDARGYVLTCSHVVDDAQRLSVTLPDGRRHKARWIADDEENDLAVLSVDAETLVAAEFAASRELSPGEPVIAVGSPYGYERTISRGIVSALKRTVEVTDALAFNDLIQTDASINTGNSGGPLFNVEGKVVGIVVAVRAGASGISFAIPADRAKSAVLAMLRAEIGASE